MTVNEIRQMSRPHRILVVEDEPLMRHLNTKMLIDAGYHVDAAEDGAAAWDTLQAKSYALLITDNTMPKVSGIELIRKVRTVDMALPVIMATALPPTEEFTRNPHLQPAATLLKPYTAAEFVGTVEKVLCATVFMVILLLCLSPAAQAQDSNDRPTAMTLSVRGKCDYSGDGVTFTNFDQTHVFEQGAIIRTGKGARVDIFFRRTGTTVRLQPDTEIKLEKMTLTMKDALPVVYTLLDLRAGRIFTVVRSKVAGNTMEIRNAAGRSVVEGSGIGRYIITADGTHVAAIGSIIPIKLIGENGVTIITAGQRFARKNGKMLPVSADIWVKDYIQLDELQATIDRATAPEPSPKL
jgi:CheY-like chemotaxis protein